MSSRNRRTRGDCTYQWIVEKGCALLRREGLEALSMRAVSEAAGLSLGTIQFHFGTHGDLARAVVRAWAAEVSRILDQVAGDACGLRRTWKLCEAWIGLRDGIGLSLEVLRADATGPKQGHAREMFVESIRNWVEQTRRSLGQAQIMHEIKAGIDLRALAIEIHQCVWSRSWISAAWGPKTAACSILDSLWHRLSAVAADPAASLPPRSVTLVARPPVEEEPADPNPPTWKMALEPSDPLYQAFYRHDLMGDPRTFCYPPEVTPDDIARAEACEKGPPRTHLSSQ